MRNNPQLLELRPNWSLLNSEFDGYKLSLTQITTISEQLKVPVDRLVPNSNQYSLLHAKLYGLHNHLIGESDDTESIYFVDKGLNVHKYTVEPITNKFSSTIVWKIPLARERIAGDYNISLKLASDKIAVASDGLGTLYILDRRDSDDQWKVVFSGDVTGSDEKFIITDVAYKMAQIPELHLLLTTIKQKDTNEKNCTVLYWITLIKNDLWSQVALRELTVNGFVQYANLERTCEAIYVVSDAGCKFTLDSEHEISQNEVSESEDEKKYKWTQGREDITITFTFSETIVRNLVKIKTEATHIKVQYNNETLLEGSLFQRIDSDMTTWTLEARTLQLVLQKLETGQMWPEIVQNDQLGEYVPDSGLIREVADRLAPLTSDVETAPPSGTTFNSQQVEECDFESDKLTIFERLSYDSHDITHKINIGSHQVLLTVKLEKDLPLALAIRNDVDACIWQPTVLGGNFTLEHKGTLLAMGYIQASKQQMKFFTCSPDLSYSVICESSRHVFIYCQNKSISSGELRNRITGKRINKLALQQVYNSPSNDEILGVYASNNYLYILSENVITALKL